MMYGKVVSGSALPQSRLNEALVKRIREEHAEKMRKVQELQRECSAAGFAKRYGVHHRTIEKVLDYESWRHVR